MTKPDLSVRAGGLDLKNPVIAASGTFGYGLEYAAFVDPSSLGAVVVKGISTLPRAGNPPPRIAETPAGMLNAIGLQNVGLKSFIKDKLPPLKNAGATTIVNLYGQSPEEFAALAAGLDKAEGVAAVELNVSCPNVAAGGSAFGADPEAVKRVTAAARAETGKPLWVKLTPNTADITLQAKAAAEAGADAVSLINTLLGMAVDVDTRRPRLKNVTGGLSGPAIRPVAVSMVYEVFRAVDIDVIGVGGIVTAEDALEFMLVGARAVQVGTAHFTDPAASLNIIDGLRRYLDDHGISNLTDIIGGLEL